VLEHEIREAVIKGLSEGVGPIGRSDRPLILLTDVLIREMRFPTEVQEAINRKMAQDQLRQEYAYRLQSEELERQRKEVEARGIAEFQAIAGISENYLRWRGIEATVELARSANAKLVIIGSPKSGLPLILNGLEQSSSGAPSGPSEPTESKPPEIAAAPTGTASTGAPATP